MMNEAEHALLDAANGTIGYIHDMKGNNPFSFDTIASLGEQGLIYLADMKDNVCQWLPTELGRSVLVSEMIAGQYALDTGELPFTDPLDDEDDYDFFDEEYEDDDDYDWLLFDDETED
jgi:hypothetical protein